MNKTSTTSHEFGAVRIRDVAAVGLLVLAACWAAGAIGLMAEPLRIAGVWLLLGLAFLTAQSKRNPSRYFWQVAALLLMLAVPLMGRVDVLHEVLLVALVAACLAENRRGSARSMFASVALAVVLWTLFLLASRGVPAIWHLSERCGQGLGALGSLLSGTRLRIGASFAAIEPLVLLALLHTIWLFAAAGRRRWRAITALAFVSAIHATYLYVLARSLDLMALLPEVAERAYEHPYTPPPWAWSSAVGTLLPWSLPFLVVVTHAAALGLLWYGSRWRTEWPPNAWSCPAWGGWSASLRLPHVATVLAILAVAVSMVSTLASVRSDLTGKVILANGQGRLDWQRPVHDRYGRQSAGMFGMLPSLVRSLGGELRVVDQWDQAELSAADAVVLLHPTTELLAEQRERILDYVRHGGALLVVAEPHLDQGDAVSGHNQVLDGTGMTVRRDVVVPVTAGWQHALQLVPHPATAGIDPRSSHFFSGMGSSLQTRWPSRPLIVGRWGWSDPGSDSLFTGIHRWEPGERLGDLVLAAEQRYGRGRIAVLSDGYSFTNEGGFRGIWLTGPLLSYLASDAGSPQSAWRQILTLLLGMGLACLLVAWPEPRRLMTTAVLLALSLAVCHHSTRHATRMVPDGRRLADPQDRAPSRLAYIGASHAEGYSDGPWSLDGIEGLALTLMRNDLLALSLPQLSREHLDAAGIYISVAPSRCFSRPQRRMLVDFVERGGILICTVGAEESAGSRSLLAEFGIRVPASPVPTASSLPEPEPMGRMRAIYLRVESEDGSIHDLGVNFFTGWPVELENEDAQVLVYGKQDLPMAVLCPFGRGSVVVIGDSGFALNKNLERFGGEPFDGGAENAHFWRWLLVHLIQDQLWLPPLDADTTVRAALPQESP